MEDLPFTVSPSVSNLTVLAQETGKSWLEFVAWYPDESKYAHVRFNLQRLIGIKMCGMGGEGGDTGIGKVTTSKWLSEINALQREYYPSHSDNFKDVRHYYVAGHDERVEFLAEGFTWEIIEELPNWLDGSS